MMTEQKRKVVAELFDAMETLIPDFDREACMIGVEFMKEFADVIDKYEGRLPAETFCAAILGAISGLKKSEEIKKCLFEMMLYRGM